jgi:hypothetical protein
MKRSGSKSQGLCKKTALKQGNNSAPRTTSRSVKAQALQAMFRVPQSNTTRPTEHRLYSSQIQWRAYRDAEQEAAIQWLQAAVALGCVSKLANPFLPSYNHLSADLIVPACCTNGFRHDVQGTRL